MAQALMGAALSVAEQAEAQAAAKATLFMAMVEAAASRAIGLPRRTELTTGCRVSDIPAVVGLAAIQAPRCQRMEATAVSPAVVVVAAEPR
jgi:hypothetical protein